MNRNKYKNSGLSKFSGITRLTNEQTDFVLSRWHYLGPIRSFMVSYGSLEGCCVFGVPRSRELHMSCPYQMVELLRMVGRPHHPWSMTSLMSQSLKLLKIDYPDIDVIISYSDPAAGHTGNVYRAANWVYWGSAVKDGHPAIFIDGVRWHPRTLYRRYGTSSVSHLMGLFGPRLTVVEEQPKDRFLYWLNKKGDFLGWFKEHKHDGN